MDEENRLRATNCLHVLSRIVPVLLEYRYAPLSSARAFAPGVMLLRAPRLQLSWNRCATAVQAKQ